MRWQEGLGIGLLFACLLGLFFMVTLVEDDRYWACVDERGEAYRRETATSPLVDRRGFTLGYEPQGLRCKEVHH